MMPLEAVACTSCGSTEVSEYKPGSYVCEHCDTVFKHVDPSKVTLQREFCACGQVVTAQCCICEKGLCRTHAEIDRSTILQWIPTSLPAYDGSGSVVPFTHAAPPGDGYWIGADPSVVFSHTAERLGTGVICQDCYDARQAEVIQELADGGACDELAARKIAGEVCAEPMCTGPADLECHCCRLKWCIGEVSAFTGWTTHATGVTSRDVPQLPGTLISQPNGGNSVEFASWGRDWAGGLCDFCWREFEALYRRLADEKGMTIEIGNRINLEPIRGHRSWRREVRPLVMQRDQFETEVRHRASDLCSLEALTTGFIAWAGVSDRTAARPIPRGSER
jgi:hypothetical protein